MSERKRLAWYQWPEPDGTSYFEEDLTDSQKVEELFDYCQILLATINKEGWQFLVKTYGITGLLDINRKSGWFDEEDDVEATQQLRYHCFISGYDLDSDLFGEYDPETGVFTPSGPNS